MLEEYAKTIIIEGYHCCRETQFTMQIYVKETLKREM